MPEGTTGSTVPRRQLGRYLRELRNEAHLTVRRAAVLLERAEATIWRIETGQMALRGADVEYMCRVYGADAEMTQALVGLAKETKAKGWWHAYGDAIPADFDVYIGLEESASELSWYESELVPGLLQTPEYARTIIEADNPDMSAEEIQRRVDSRIERHSILTRRLTPLELRVVLNEAVLRRPVGGPSVMAPQLRHLVRMTALPNVVIRVMPFTSGLHTGVLVGPFVLLRFPLNGHGRESEPATVFVDGPTGALYLDRPHEVDRYAAAFDAMWETALSESASKTLLTRTAREMTP